MTRFAPTPANVCWNAGARHQARLVGTTSCIAPPGGMLGSNLLRKARGHQVLNSEQRWLCLRLERLSLEAEVRSEANTVLTLQKSFVSY